MNVEFIEELRLEYERRERASESLPKKTKDLMMVSGIIAALIMGFYGSFVKPTEFQIDNLLNVLLISEGLMLFTVILCIWSNKVEFQQTVLLGSKLTKDSKTNFNIIKSWIKTTKENYYDAIIDKYVKCLQQAEERIASKATRLTVAICIFTCGLILFPIMLIIALAWTNGA